MKSEGKPDGDLLDALLREADDLADDGFTTRVLAALPRRRKRSWLRPAILGLAMLAGSGIAVAFLPELFETLHTFTEQLGDRRPDSVLLLLPFLLAFAPIIWCGFAMMRELLRGWNGATTLKWRSILASAFPSAFKRRVPPNFVRKYALRSV